MTKTKEQLAARELQARTSWAYSECLRLVRSSHTAAQIDVHVARRDGLLARRTFTATFKLGDYVSIKRTEHGWFDGTLFGHIVELTDHFCVVEVREDDGTTCRYDIQRPRDIKLCMEKA